eukprot:CAMPEP_0177671442 /NCGR_PEP_ID=MMETSP0447-20121125/24708_1 /TAXON_ID=0 /ORGANISM="Stygamoeba regulata, Strain BSH-02190019" /LENGTH=74 /DNA_ID=CAMNT_0019178839 /DNA_START=91 /DNA_END=311 /DNA_ORIENTATION=+
MAFGVLSSDAASVLTGASREVSLCVSTTDFSRHFSCEGSEDTSDTEAAGSLLLAALACDSRNFLRAASSMAALR